MLECEGHLVVAHDRADARRGTPLTLAQALEPIVAAGRPVLADLKTPRAADLLAAALALCDWGPRTVVSGSLPALERCACGCGAARAWTLPAGDDASARAGPFGLATAAARARVSAAATRALGEGRCEAVSVDRHFLTPELVAAVHAAGARVYAWTVDSDAELRRAIALDVDGLITSRSPRARELLGAPV